MSGQLLYCRPVTLDPSLWQRAAKLACDINPANASMVQALPVSLQALLIPDHIAVLTNKYWGTKGVDLTVSFMDGPSSSLRSKILAHMNSWGTEFGANVKFRETSQQGRVRIARTKGEGYYSYLGPDIDLIPMSQCTMNLDSFSDSTPDSEFFRVVRHETGHTLGFPHEHMRRDLVARLDEQKTIDWFQTTYGWDETTTRQQVLTPLDEKSLMGTPVDITSIMCYQLPGSITIDGKPIPGGLNIDQSDAAFAKKIYPSTGAPPGPTGEVYLFGVRWPSGVRKGQRAFFTAPVDIPSTRLNVYVAGSSQTAMPGAQPSLPPPAEGEAYE